jgi:hypothetical protein
MIQKFNQFINENVNQNRLFQEINEPVSDFVDRIRERTKMFIGRINELTATINKAVEEVMEEFGDAIVGDPIVEVARDLWDIEVNFNTNIPNDIHWESNDDDEESLAEELENRLGDIADYYGGARIRAGVLSKPNKDGNCIIYVRIYIVDEKNFGEFTDAIHKFGEEY